MNSKLREVLICAATQCLSYCLLTVNFRAIAHGNVAVAVLSDGTYATFQFWIIRHIAKSESSVPGWIGYVIGSMIGTVIGINLT